MELWRRRRLLGHQTIAKRRLYLDVRFWNDLCDAELGENQTASALDCLAFLRRHVAEGLLVCPAEFNVVAEVYKQKLPAKQAATLCLIDELSQRTAIAKARERMFLECLRLLQGALQQTPPTAPPSTEVWTRPLFVAGHEMPDLPAPDGIPPAVVNSLRDEFDAELWEYGFERMVDLAGGFPPDLDNSAATAARLNGAKTEPSNLFKSYEATYWSEVRGALDAYHDVLGDIALYLFERQGGDVSSVTGDQVRESASGLRSLIYAFARKHGLKSVIPSLHIGVTLYSRVQWDRARRYRANDVYDFAHAEAALPYCNAFATEGPLAALIRSSGLAKDYPCDVLTDLDGINAWLASWRRATVGLHRSTMGAEFIGAHSRK